MNGLDASYFREEAWRPRTTAAARAPASAAAWAHPGPTSRLAMTRRSACLSEAPKAKMRPWRPPGRGTHEARTARTSPTRFSATGPICCWRPRGSHISSFVGDRELGGWLRALGRFARVISMDQRGIGLSDRMTQMIDLETA